MILSLKRSLLVSKGSILLWHHHCVFRKESLLTAEALSLLKTPPVKRRSVARHSMFENKSREVKTPQSILKVRQTQSDLSPGPTPTWPKLSSQSGIKVNVTTTAGMHLGRAIAGIPPYLLLGRTLKDVQRHKWRKNKAFGPLKRVACAHSLTCVMYMPTNKRKLTTSAFTRIQCDCESAFHHSPAA